uniref:Retrotransposon gag domain-containing protein n=1 Tax=Cannabis sativa TaxID=3483 RepID=A0A803QAX4_CANSA
MWHPPWGPDNQSNNEARHSTMADIEEGEININTQVVQLMTQVRENVERVQVLEKEIQTFRDENKMLKEKMESMSANMATSLDQSSRLRVPINTMQLLESTPMNVAQSTVFSQSAMSDISRQQEGVTLPMSTNMNFIDTFNLLGTTMPLGKTFDLGRKLDKLSDDLYHIKQKRSESLRDYIGRFNKEKVSIPYCNVDTAITTFYKTLQMESDLYKELTKYPCRTMEDVLAKAWT